MYFISQWSLCNILEEMQFSLWFRLFMDTQYTGYFILILIHYSQPSSHQRHQNGLFLNHLKNSKTSWLLWITRAICSTLYLSVKVCKWCQAYLYSTISWQCFWHPTHSHCENSGYHGNKQTTIRASYETNTPWFAVEAAGHVIDLYNQGHLLYSHSYCEFEHYQSNTCSCSWTHFRFFHHLV